MSQPGTVAERQGAVGCGMVIAWVLTLPIVVILYLFGYWPASLGLLVALAVIGFWFSARAKREPEGVPDAGLPEPGPQGPLP